MAVSGVLAVPVFGLMVMAQVAPDDDAKLKAGLEDLIAIDQELQAITENQDALAKSEPARRDEIVSLQARYPEIILTPKSSTREIYRALYAVRMARAHTLLPIAKRKKAMADAEVCKSVADLRQTRKELEGTKEYQHMGLKDRLELRADFDNLINSANPKCAPGGE